MSDLISRQLLISKLANSTVKFATYDDWEHCCDVIQSVEREKGEWIPVTKIYKVTEDQFPNMHIEWVDASEPDEIDAVRCSECGEVFDFQDARNFCTECWCRYAERGEMMARYINADVLIEKIIKKATEMFTVDSVYQHYLNALIDVEDIIKAESTADVVERKKGEWIACEHDKWMHGVYALRCSNCNGGYHISTEKTIGTWDFCPNCGADMRKEVEQ